VNVESVPIAAVQMNVDPVDHFDDYAGQIESIMEQTRGAHIVVFPELVTIPLFTIASGWQDDSIASLARISEYTGLYCELFGGLARKNNQHILAGTHLIQHDKGVLNAAHLFSSDGSVHVHAKTHMTPTEIRWGGVEGQTLDPIDLGDIRVGITICYEAEIPEVATILARKGADLILCPSYTSTVASYWRVRHSMAARCIENLVFSIHCPMSCDLGYPLPCGVGQAAILTPCDPSFPSNGVLAETQDDKQQILRAKLEFDDLYENRLYGASTFRDRPRRSNFYYRYAKELFAADTYHSNPSSNKP
jgi:predicted amidohydrolase